ncbi:MAG: twin-arginine translocase TatA/TatE family subunit [Bacillota bacterium]
MSEIIFLAVLALIVIGPKELPQVARTIGRFLNELKRSTSSLTDELKEQARIDRINLYEAPQKPSAKPNHEPHSHNPPSVETETKPVPEQLELTEQHSGNKTDKEHKPS